MSDPEARLQRSLGQNLTRLIEDAYARLPRLASLELLAITGPTNPTLTIHGSQTRSHNTGEAINACAHPSTKIAVLADEYFPAWFGVERGRLDLDPLGFSAVPTSRLVATSTASTLSSTEAPLQSALKRIRQRGHPAICQLLVQQPKRETYRVTIRLAEICPHWRPHGHRAVANDIANPLRCPLDEAFPDGFTSSRLLANRYWDVRVGRQAWLPENEYALSRRMFTDDEEIPAESAQITRTFTESTHEYAALMRGAVAAEPYDQLDVDPTFTCNRDELASLVDLLPLYGEVDWPTSVRRSPPQFERTEIVSEAAGTDHEALLASPTNDRAGPGIDPASSLTSFVEGWLAEAGIQSETVEDRAWDQPHFLGHPIDPSGPVLVLDRATKIADTPASTAGELIATVARAVRTDQHLLVVTPDSETTRWAREILLQPFHLQGNVTRLYPAPAELRTRDGAFLVTERDGPRPTWLLTPSGTRQLRLEDRTLHSRNEEFAASLSNTLPRAHRTGDGVIVTEADSTPIERYDALSEITADWRVLRRPVVATQLTYPNMTVLTREGCELRWLPATPVWADTTDSRIISAQRYAAVAHFVETYTVPCGDSERTVTDFPDRFLPWFREQADYQFPDPTLLADAIPDGLAVETDESGLPTTLSNRRWRFPSGLAGPSLDSTAESIDAHN